jgi:acyl-ACP thioesterase
MDDIPQEFTLNGAVSYWNVDRDNVLTLRSLFAFLQEAAIKHADKCGAGAHAKETRGESWVLHRMAVRIHRYPRYEEPLTVSTWSSGIRAFKGFRDFRVRCGDELVASASSVWLYLSLATKAVCRVPREIAAGFPTRPADVFCGDLERMKLESPADGAPAREITVRYSDFDANDHVNNTVYFDYLQTALAAGGLPPRPGLLKVEFLREIPLSVETVTLALERRGEAAAFSLGRPGGLFARGLAECG